MQPPAIRTFPIATHLFKFAYLLVLLRFGFGRFFFCVRHRPYLECFAFHDFPALKAFSESARFFRQDAAYCSIGFGVFYHYHHAKPVAALSVGGLLWRSRTNRMQ